MADLSTQIKNALKIAGLDEDLADQITVEKEEEIKSAVEELKKEVEDLKSLSSEDFLTAVSKAGLTEPMKRYLQSETDKRVTDAIKTHDAKLTKDKDDEKTITEKEKEKEGMTEDQKEILSMKQSIQKQNETLQELMKKTSEKDISTAIQDELKTAEINEGFAEFIHVNTVDEVGGAVKNLKDKVLAEQQQKFDKKLEEAGVPIISKGKTSSEMESAIADYAEKKNVTEGEGGIIADQLKAEKGEK